MDMNVEILTMEWIEKILCVDFMGREVLREQINHAYISFSQHHEYISIKFHMRENVPKFPYSIRVPVSLLAWQKNQIPINFLLHVKNGFIDELEIVAMDLQEIDASNIDLSNIEYDIDKSLRLM